MTLFFTTNSMTVYRQRRVGATNRHTMSATGTVHPIDITPAALERLQFVQGEVGKSYVGYVEVTADVKEGDTVVITDTAKRYMVKSVSRWEGFGAVDCKELDLVSKD